MRVLLIDNHDSFTYNLAHDVAAVTGRLPDVVAHDAPLPAPVTEWLRGYDAIVVSPGPGTPDRPADLGHSAAAVAQGDVPVLGVCLGMQAIGVAAGARIVRAPRPVHGEVAAIRHDGGGVFAGLPDPLPMVRYHSLVLADLPDDLVVDATCDGLVMGLHHRTRPQWGVQTHPESISSAHGRDLVAGFLRLAAEWNARHGRVPAAAPPAGVDAPESPSTAAVTGGPAPRVLVEEVTTDADAEVVFDTCFRRHDHAWWLDSAAGGGFSACGSAAGPLARVAVQRPDGLEIRDAYGRHVTEADLLTTLGRRGGTPVFVDAADRVVDAPPVPFALGWVGYLGYEHATALLLDEPLVAAPTDTTPLSTWVFTDRAVVLHGDRAWVLALLADAPPGRAPHGDALPVGTPTHAPEDPPDTVAHQRRWVTDTVSRIGALTGATAGEVPPPPRVGQVTIRHGRADYLGRVHRCLAEIVAGESYELCLTNRITVRADGDPWDLYRRLRRTSPRPFAAYLALDGAHVLSASPERFLSVDAAGVVEAKPIKGTRRRGATPEEDAALAAELAADVKERAENLMIVDLLRHDLSRVCAPGSVEVPLLFDVETHAGVHQLVSTIRGRLAPGRGGLDAVRAALPGGSMTGAPKERSVRLLRDLDGGPRGVYSGVLGYVSLTGEIDLSIVIRTIVHHGDHLTYGVGGAVTARSDAVAEWEETLVKARTLGTALGLDLDPLLDGDAR